jgi:hypothetical protein
MSTNHNRIKVADLETTDQPNKILITNNAGELEFSDINNNYNALDYNVEGKALDARQGKILKTLIDSLTNSKVDKTTDERLITASEISKLLGIQAGAQVNQDISGKQDTNNQIFVNTSGLVQDSWHGKLVIFTANVTITIPANGLRSGFNFEGIVDPSFTVNTVITAPKTWFGSYSGASITENSIFAFVQRANDDTKVSIYGL